MVDLSAVPMEAFTGRLLTVFFLSFFIIIATARIIGSERRRVGLNAARIIRC